MMLLKPKAAKNHVGAPFELCFTMAASAATGGEKPGLPR